MALADPVYLSVIPSVLLTASFTRAELRQALEYTAPASVITERVGAIDRAPVTKRSPGELARAEL